MSEHAIPVEWLALYHDGELDQARRQQVEEHLLTCAVCQRELAALKSLNRALGVDRLPEEVLTEQAAFWRELKPQLPERAATSAVPIQWLPGVGLLVMNGVVQFIAAAGVVVALVAGPFPWIAQPVGWLSRALAGWLFGWLAWLPPAEWSGWGLSLFLIALSAWLAVLYLAWLGYAWRHRQASAVRLMI